MKRFIFIITLISFRLSLYCQPFVHTTLYDNDTEELQGRLINTIQDQIGYIWLGTHNGLHKYDGQNFKNYKIDPEIYSPLTSNHITKIVNNSINNIWCLSDDHVFLFDAPKEAFINIQDHIDKIKDDHIQIGRASCRDRVYAMWSLTVFPSH